MSLKLAGPKHARHQEGMILNLAYSHGVHHIWGCPHHVQLWQGHLLLEDVHRDAPYEMGNFLQSADTSLQLGVLVVIISRLQPIYK